MRAKVFLIIILISECEANNLQYQIIKKISVMAHLSQKKQSELSADEDSIQLMVQPQKKQMLIHTDFDIKIQEDDHRITLYIELDSKNVQELIKQSSKGKGFDDDRKHVKNCIFMRKIDIPESKMKGNFHITYLAYKGISFNIYLNCQDAQQPIYSRLRLHYQIQDRWVNQWLSNTAYDSNKETSKTQTYCFEVKASEVDKILKEKLLLQFFFEKHPSLSKQYNGLLNQGNLCYMNSMIQVLYHFKPFRKLIVEQPTQKNKKVLKNLQEIFVQMMTSNRTVSAQSLLHCFDQFNGYPRQQQDIHEFLIALFDELEAELPEVKHFWCGQESQRTFSKDKDKKYSSKQEQDFNQLQLFMADSMGNHFLSLQQSLGQLLKEQKMDTPLQTDQFGKIQAFKTRHFTSLPPLLFLNLRRYEYNPRRKQLKKINLDLTYPSELNLDFLMKTPDGSLNYQLYSVVVHKGKEPNSGHYFSFINVSNDERKMDWFEFNDSKVRTSTSEKVLQNFTGKKKKQIYLNETYGKWTLRDEISEETAYLLVYIRKDQFDIFQNVQINLPSWHLERLQQKLTEEQAKTKVAVKLFVLKDLSEFDPFSIDIELMEAKLLKSSTFEAELKAIQPFLSCTVGSIWKVNRKTNKIKRIHRRYGQKSVISIEKHSEFKRGFRQPDYFLVIPTELMPEDGQNNQNLGLLLLRQISEQGDCNKLIIEDKAQIKNGLQEMRKDGANITLNNDEFQSFYRDWNDLLTADKE